MVSNRSQALFFIFSILTSFRFQQTNRHRHQSFQSTNSDLSTLFLIFFVGDFFVFLLQTNPIAFV